MSYISKESAEIYYNELLKNYQYETNFLYNKVPMLKNLMEDEILKEITRINHFKNPYESGQLKWLKDNIEKRYKNGDIIKGFVPPKFISGIEYLFDQRNWAEHKKVMTYAIYLSLLNTVADTISFFSETEIPKRIMDIFSGDQERLMSVSKITTADNYLPDAIEEKDEVKKGSTDPEDRKIKSPGKKLK